jgi:hypothetical protein
MTLVTALEILVDVVNQSNRKLASEALATVGATLRSVPTDRIREAAIAVDDDALAAWCTVMDIAMEELE